MKNIILAFVDVQPVSDRTDGVGFTLADGMYIPDVFIRTGIVILLFYVATSFLLTLIRMLLDYRLKSKMIHMGITGDEAEKILRKDVENKDHAFKWFLLLLSIGIGFAVISSFPFGWLSVGMLAFSLSLGYAGYFIYLKKRKDTF